MPVRVAPADFGCWALVPAEPCRSGEYGCTAPSTIVYVHEPEPGRRPTALSACDDLTHRAGAVEQLAEFDDNNGPTVFAFTCTDLARIFDDGMTVADHQRGRRCWCAIYPGHPCGPFSSTPFTPAPDTAVG